MPSVAGLQWRGQMYDRQLVGNYRRRGKFRRIFVGVIRGRAKVRYTGRYDNVSFIIKTKYWHTLYLYV